MTFFWSSIRPLFFTPWLIWSIWMIWLWDAIASSMPSLVVSANTVTNQVGHQLEQQFAPFSVAEFSDAVHDAVARVAHEVLEEHLVACGLP